MSLPQRTLLAVPITAADTVLARQQILSAQAARADILEFRLDLMADSDWSALLAETSLPVIATARPTDQGGEFAGSESQRLDLLKKVAQARPAFIDFEFPHFIGSAKAREFISSITCDSIDADKPGLIMSFHDFESVPSNLDDIVSQISDTPAAVVKIVCFAQSIQDNFSLFDFAHQASRPSIILAMGQAGQISRVLAAKLGTFLSFSCLSTAESSAPGQISVDRLRSLYRWDRISRSTAVYGVIGFPLGHSLSPAIHNAAFEDIGFDGLYLPFLIEPAYERFAAFMDSFLAREFLDLRGLSVTIPHKENALRYLQQHNAFIDPPAQRIGCVNTIVISPDGNLAGYNTDLDAALDALTAGAGISHADLAGRAVAVLGAGGVARALVAGLTAAGADVFIYNRTAERARSLAEEFGATAIDLAELPQTTARIIVNCTSLGMHPDTGASPFPCRCLSSDMIVFDTVYNPPRTRLLTQAVQAGAKTVNGTDMFINQAARQFSLWTNQPAPVHIMHQVLKDVLL
ncbi:MAG: shikimate dehydrogenase [Actinobacteria bacterium]|nr:shikimate dehydrogenase [Actinomycetota bacterium]